MTRSNGPRSGESSGSFAGGIPTRSLYLVRRDESGAELTYAIEMGSPNQMVKIGFTRDAMKPGDSIEIRVHPSFTNPAVGENLTPDAITINGRSVASRPRRPGPIDRFEFPVCRHYGNA